MQGQDNFFKYFQKHFDFIVIDLSSMFIAFILAYYLKFNDLNFYQYSEWNLFLFIIILFCFFFNVILYPYSEILKREFYWDIITALHLLFYNILATGIVFYIFKMGMNYSRELYFSMYGIYFFLSLTLKYFWKKYLLTRKKGILAANYIPLFIISNRKNIEKTIYNIGSEDIQLYDIEGIHLIDDTEQNQITSEKFGYIPVFAENYIEYILARNITDVLVAVNPESVGNEFLKKLYANGVRINIVLNSFIDFQSEDQNVLNFGLNRTLSLSTFSFTLRQKLYLHIKRLWDIILALCGCVILIPVTIFVKLAYLLNHDTADIFFCQNRVGMNGKPFRIIKYRSMVPNAEEQLAELLKDEKNLKEWNEKQKLENDPRVSKVGRFLRRTSLDELPQLINVIKGDMSFVGPRPLIEGELEQHGGLKFYQIVRPGITGWWACNGRSNIDYDRRLEMEYYYIKNCSLFLDLVCLFRTFFAVLKKNGAQ